MKNEQLEKQASSEIAESRERFEKWAKPRFSSECFRRSKLGHYFDGGVQGEWEVWEQAERDTRELCAQELEAEAKRLYATGLGSQMDMSGALENMAERIRGKEVS